MSYAYCDDGPGAANDHRGWCLKHTGNTPPLHYAYTATHAFNDVLTWDGTNSRVNVGAGWEYFDNDSSDWVKSGSSTNLQGYTLNTYSTADYPIVYRYFWQISMATMTPNTEAWLKPKYKVHMTTDVMGNNWAPTNEYYKCNIQFPYYPMYDYWTWAVQYLEFEMPLSECP